MFTSLGPLELLIILLIVIALFGAGRIAGVGQALGKSVREFRSEARAGLEDEEEEEGEGDDEAKAAESAEAPASTMASADATAEGAAEAPAEKKPES
ncbi:MAG: twin-arginine translocase TatA/TatE family subunit [Chloroflexi bacterium]|nr:twin-arginine translocase TatA/TatE family subunit [Chloroflexota bacterium]